MTALVNLVDFSHGLKFTESPRPYGNGLLFLDIHDSAIKQVDIEGNLETVKRLPFKPNSLGLGSDGVIRVGDAFGRKIYKIVDGELELFADFSDEAIFGLSDGILAGPGRQHLFMCCSDSHDPGEIAANPTARLYVLPTAVAGSGTP